MRRKEWLWFTIFGPPLGGFLFIAAYSYHNSWAYTNGSSITFGWQDIGYLFLSSGLIAVMSYIFGILPAAIVGVLACYLRNLQRYQYIAALSAAGGILALICGFWIENRQVALLAFAAGAFSAGLIATWLRRKS